MSESTLYLSDFNFFNNLKSVTLYFLAFDVNWCSSWSVIKNKYNKCKDMKHKKYLTHLFCFGTYLCMVVSREQNAGQNSNQNIGDKSFEKVKEFKYWEQL